ncbi:MAG TPA: amino acid permease, partial [Candidatus Acidoferrales bacterium]|nr:amino acid permease [Candidatus Acidoferrales bacterium]
LVPGSILRQLNGSVGLGLLVWITGGFLSLLGALTYGELAAMKPEAGGVYVYIRDCFGPLPAFLYGWMLFLVGASGSVATLAVAFSVYLRQIVPLTPLAGKAAAVAMIAVVTAANVRGTRESADLQNWTTILKIAAILALSAVLLVLGRGYAGMRLGEDFWPAHASRSLFSAFGVAMIAALWAYEGWQYATFSAAEAVNPQRDFPRAFSASMIFLAIIYILANIGYLAALGPKAAAASDAIAASAIAAAWNPHMAKFVALAILVSVFSAANGIQLTAPRVFYTMAAEGLFFRRLAEIHPRYRTPAAAIVTGGIWAAVLACWGTFQQLLTYVIFTSWAFYGLAAASIFVYRRRQPGLERPYRVPGYPWTPALFVLAAAILVINTIIAGPGGAAEGAGIVLLGVPVYLLWRARPRARLS